MGKLLLLLLPAVFSQFISEKVSNPGFKISSTSETIAIPGAGDPYFGCPAEVKCNESALYRELDGKCNNLKHSIWGSAGVKYQRFLRAKYNDDLTLCGANNCGSYTCSKLPKARQVVAALNSLPTGDSSKITVLTMVFGQIISHDINLTPSVSGLTCCVNCSENPTENINCLPVDVKYDAFYKEFNKECLENSRSAPAGASCSAERQQVNSVTAYIDASIVYGIAKDAADQLRTFTNGTMKVDGDEDLEGTSCPAVAVCPFKLLPTVLTGGSERILAGDGRAPQNPALTALHALGVRIHNAFATRLKEKHSEYYDEELYQEARQRVIALIQHICYNEFLPSILPSWALSAYGLRSLSPGEGYFNFYDKHIDATLHNAFSAAAYRFGHSTIPNFFNLKDGTFFELSEAFIKHDFTYILGQYPSDILNGISFQKSPELDQNLVISVSGRLFAPGPNNEVGGDLYSFNIQRGRDHGLPSYKKWRKFCNLPAINNFEELNAVMKEGVADEFKKLYKRIGRIELYPALISEKAESDGIVGPTLTCLLGKQFSYLKHGDRFFYENKKHPNKFTLVQLDTLRRIKFSDVLCRFTNAKEVPEYAMKVLGPGNNMINCSRGSKGTVLADWDEFF